MVGKNVRNGSSEDFTELSTVEQKTSNFWQEEGTIRKFQGTILLCLKNCRLHFSKKI